MMSSAVETTHPERLMARKLVYWGNILVSYADAGASIFCLA